MIVKNLLRRIVGDPLPVYVDDPQTLRQIAEDVSHAVREVEREYGIRLTFGRRHDRVLTLSALQATVGKI